MAETEYKPTRNQIEVPGAKWSPLKHTVVRDAGLTERIHIDGFAVVDFLNESQLETLRAIHHREHKLDVSGGGMFYSLYSHDYAYRKRIDDEIRDILTPSFDHHFENYENIINLFVVKVSGPASEFAIHQDTTAMDETKYSPLSVWIPLWDIGPEDGAMCFVRHSHWFFSPYRSISFPFPFAGIYKDIRPYLEPVYLKAGQAIVFDPRLLHNSLQNSSGKDRVTIVSGIFPPEAEIITCYKDPEVKGAPIELLKEPENFLLEYPNFFHNCHAKPETGRVIGIAEFDMPAMNAQEFQALCALNGVEPVNAIPSEPGIQCKMISEPIEQFAAAPIATQGTQEPEKGILGRVLGALGIGKN